MAKTGTSLVPRGPVAKALTQWFPTATQGENELQPAAAMDSLVTLLSSAWSGEGNCGHPRHFPPGFQQGCDSLSSAGSPGARLIARVCMARLEPAQGESPQTHTGRLWGPQHQLFCSLCSRTYTNMRLCYPTSAPVQLHQLRHRHTQAPLCHHFPLHPSQGIPWASCLGCGLRVHPENLPCACP